MDGSDRHAAVATPKHALLPIGSIEPNPFQSRTHFAPRALEDLARSISQSGILQPVVVRPHPADTNRYQLVVGERRWREWTLFQP